MFNCTAMRSGPERRVRYRDTIKTKKVSQWDSKRIDKIITTGTLLMLALVFTISMITSGGLSALVKQTRAAVSGHSVVESGASAADYIIAQD